MHRAVDESNSSHTIDPNTTDGSGVETPVVVRYYRLGTTQRHQTDRMLQDIKERILQKRREEYAEKDCTFRPQTERPPSTNVSVGKWSNESASSEQVYARLSRYAEERSRRLEEKSRQKERNEDEALHGLFQPIINSRKFNRSYSTASAPVEERLLNYGEEVNLSLEAKRKEREQRLEWEVRHPSHSVQSTAESAASFDYRNQTLLQKRERLWVEAERKLRDGASFAPKVCPTSSAIDYANLKKSGLNAAFPGSNDRGALLYYTHQATGEELSRAEQEAERAARYANRPQTNPNSSRWIEQSDHRPLFEKDFIERQQIYLEAKEQEKVLQEKEEALKKQETKKTVVRTESLVDRLYNKPLQRAKEREAQNAQAKEQEFSKKYSFTPSLSPGTNYVLEKIPLKEQNVVKRLTSTSATRQAEEERSTLSNSTEHTAKTPFVDTTNVNMALTPPKKVVTRAEADLFYKKQTQAVELKKQKILDGKKMESAKELSQCTFAPKTNGAPRTSSSTVRTTDVVLGVQQYLMRQEAARQSKEEQEERERNLGRCRSAQGGRNGFTTFAPFHLKTAEKEERQLRRSNSYRMRY